MSLPRSPARPGRASRALSGILAVLAVASGCYAYAPVRPEAVTPGQDVRVTVDEALAERHADALGTSSRTWEGRVEGRDGADLLLTVPTTVREGRSGSEVLGQRIRVRPGDLLSVDVRTLDTWRTVLVVGGAAAAAVVAVVRGWVDLGGSGGNGPGPGPEQLRPSPN